MEPGHRHHGVRRVRPGPMLAILAAAAGLPRSAAAQTDRSILGLLPVEAELALGMEVEDALTERDFVAGGRRVRAYSFSGARGAPLTIDAISDAFDAFLHLVGPGGDEIDSDDDSGGQCNARISTFLPADGEYRIVVASLSGGTGAFTLRVADRESPPAEGDCGISIGEDGMTDLLGSIEPVGTIGPGEEVAGRLEPGDDSLETDGSFVEAYRLSGPPGTTAVVDLISSDFDALLFVVEPDGSSYLQDDDSGGACNARAAVTLGARPHRIVVNTLSAGGGGDFTLRVSAVAPPPADGPCPGGPAPAAR